MTINNTKLKNMFKLSSKITVYVPSTININQSINNTEHVDKIASLLSSCFGGATSTIALGYWESATDGLIKEKTTVIFAYCSDTDLQKHIESVVEACEELKKDLNQEAIALEINGDMYFI